MERQEVIIEDINKDTSNMPIFARDPCPALVNHGMRIGEYVNLLVLAHAAKESVAHPDAVVSLDQIRE